MDDMDIMDDMDGISATKNDSPKAVRHAASQKRPTKGNKT
jgi:hypothetical protein